MRRGRRQPEPEIPAAEKNQRALQEWRLRNAPRPRTYMEHPELEAPRWVPLSLAAHAVEAQEAEDTAARAAQVPKPSWWKSYLPPGWGRR